jgi:amidohydrolase
MTAEPDHTLVTDCVALRHELHRTAELSGEEAATAALLRDRLRALGPDRLQTGIGGHGVLAVFEGDRPGADVLLRCETDALPIADPDDLPHASRRPGVAHKCGHDGHMAIAAAVAASLAHRRPEAGRVTLLFQPSEETGEGAARVLDDPALRGTPADFAVALHNLPGFATGTLVLRDGPFAFASVVADIRFRGVESHAAEPEKGKSPAALVAETIGALLRLGAPDRIPPDVGAVTVAHARLGEPAFGTSPGAGRVGATLRARSEEELTRLREETARLVDGLPYEPGLSGHLEWRESFPATVCDPAVNKRIEECARALGRAVHRPAEPFRWSEDFGHFTARTRSALFGLGAGVDHPALHRPEYDFPDELVGIGAALMERVVRSLAESPPPVSGAAGVGSTERERAA